MIGLSVLTISCQKDDLYEDYGSNFDDFAQPTLKILKARDINKNTHLTRELQKLDIPTRTTFSNQDEESDTYYNLQDFKINTTIAKKITDQEYTTYTFGIKSKDENFSSSKLFNLVFHKSTEEQDFSSRILVVYHLSEQQRIEIENKTTPKGKVFVSFHLVDEQDNLYPPIKTNNQPTTGDEEDGDLLSPGYWYDDDGWLHFLDDEDGGADWTIALPPVLIEVDHWSPGFGIPEWGDDADNPYPGGGNPDFDNSPGGNGGFSSIITETESEDNPCDEINEQFSDEDLKDELKDLNNQENSSTEVGFSENTDGTFYAGTNGTETSLNINIDMNTIGYAHLHLTTPMFSPTDLETFWSIIRFTHNDGRNTGDAYGIMIHSEGSYMLRFNGNYANDHGIFNGSRPTGKEMENKYNEMFDRQGENLEKTFISYVEEYMLNDNKKFSDFFDLYGFQINEDGEIIEVTKKELNGDQIESDPCE